MPAPAGYVEVVDRLRAFFEAYPDGSIQSSPPRVVEIGGKTFIEVTSTAYRNPTDPRPGIASAWELFPGATGYTRDSEMMNGETSAIGRALAALGLEVRRSIATAEDVRNRQPDPPAKTPLAERRDVVRARLSAYGDTLEDRKRLVELIVGHETGALSKLPVAELDQVEAALRMLDDGTVLLELDDTGAPRIVTAPDPEPEEDA